MKIYYSLAELKSFTESIHLALGVFDGVHVGHQEVIKTAVMAAEESGGKAGVLTFSPHPIQVLAPDRAPKRILASTRHKAELLGKLGCAFTIVQKFSQELAAKRAKEFVQEIVESCQNLKSLSVGEDWQFGKGREGNVESLQEWGEQFGFEVFASAPVIGQGERVSSTRIRQAIRDGNLAAVKKMLGRPYAVFGEVLQGRQLARTLGFPTANVKVYNEQLPPDGVWAVDVRVGNNWYPGIGNLGKRPTIENDANAQRLLEVHLFDFDGNLYGQELCVRFKAYVRKEMKFPSAEALRKQIEEDVAFVHGKF